MLPEKLYPAGEKVKIIQRLIVEEQRTKPKGKGKKQDADHPGQTAFQHAGAVQQPEPQQSLQDEDDDYPDKVFRNSHKNLKELQKIGKKENGRSFHSRQMKFNKKGLTNAKR